MTTEEVRKEILTEFGPLKSLTNEVYDKLATLKNIFNLSTEELFVKWESFNVTGIQEDLELSLPNLDRFNDYLQTTITSKGQFNKKINPLPSSGIKRKPTIRSNTNLPSTPNIKRLKPTDITPHNRTPKLGITESSPAVYETANNSFVSPEKDEKTPLSQKLTSQQDSNTIIETLNPSIDELPGFVDLYEDASTNLKPFKLASNFDAAKYKYRTMAMKLLESADVLDEQIDNFAQIYQDQFPDQKSQFENPCLSSQFEILCCGRIVPDSPTYDTSSNLPLNSTSLFLETSRISGIGQRIPLDLSNLREYSFFPGQIVVLKGKNPTGRIFIVEEVKTLPSLGAPITSRKELEEFRELTNQNGLKIMVAAGPYSNLNTLNYEKFENLVERINGEVKPHILILHGPFIDLTNISVAKGDIEFINDTQQPKNLDEVFKKLITPILRKICPRIQVILIPSLKDSVSKHSSYPQDSFERKKFGLPKNVKIFPNPSSFFINEVLIGCSNIDVYKDLRDVSKLDPGSNVISNNRFERISNHIFDQRRYYPYFPGSIKHIQQQDPSLLAKLHDGSMREEIANTGVGGSCLEVPYLGLTEIGDYLPDILISPSELRFFAKVIKGVVVINPGYFFKPNRDQSKEDGSYVVLSINAPDLSQEAQENVEPSDDSSDLYFHNIYKRTRVDIYKS